MVRGAHSPQKVNNVNKREESCNIVRYSYPPKLHPGHAGDHRLTTRGHADPLPAGTGVLRRARPTMSDGTSRHHSTSSPPRWADGAQYKRTVPAPRNWRPANTAAGRTPARNKSDCAGAHCNDKQPTLNEPTKRRPTRPHTDSYSYSGHDVTLNRPHARRPTPNWPDMHGPVRERRPTSWQHRGEPRPPTTLTTNTEEHRNSTTADAANQR